MKRKDPSTRLEIEQLRDAGGVEELERSLRHRTYVVWILMRVVMQHVFVGSL